MFHGTVQQWCRERGKDCGGALRESDLALSGASVSEATGRFGISGVDGPLAWKASGRTEGVLHVGGASVGRLALGGFDLPYAADGWRVEVPEVRVPVLDGQIVIDRLVASRDAGGQWAWTAGGSLHPVSMLRLSNAHETEVTLAPDAPLLETAQALDRSVALKWKPAGLATAYRVYWNGAGNVSAGDAQFYVPDWFGQPPRPERSDNANATCCGVPCAVTHASSRSRSTSERFITGLILGMCQHNRIQTIMPVICGTLHQARVSGPEGPGS